MELEDKAIAAIDRVCSRLSRLFENYMYLHKTREIFEKQGYRVVSNGSCDVLVYDGRVVAYMIRFPFRKPAILDSEAIDRAEELLNELREIEDILTRLGQIARLIEAVENIGLNELADKLMERLSLIQ